MISIQRLKELWNEYNAKVFDYELKEPTFRITRSSSYHGMCVTKSSNNHTRITLMFGGPAILQDGADIREVLLHEMVHQYQAYRGLIDNVHDETFTQWIPFIKEITGIELDMSECNDT